MIDKKTQKVSFRVAPSAKEGLELLAECGDTTVANFVRDCVNYVLTLDKERLPKTFRSGFELGNEFPTVR